MTPSTPQSLALLSITRTDPFTATTEISAFYADGEDIRTRELAKQIQKLEAAGDQSATVEQGKLRLKALKRANLARLERPERARANLSACSTRSTV